MKIKEEFELGYGKTLYKKICGLLLHSALYVSIRK